MFINYNITNTVNVFQGFEPCIWLGFAFTVLLLKFVTLIMDESNPLDREFRSGSLWSVVAGLGCRNHHTLVNRFYMMALVGCGCFAFVESGFFVSAIVVVERAPLCVTSLVSWYYMGGLQALSVAGESRTGLYGVNLSRTGLYGVNLSRIGLYGVNLSRTGLYGVNPIALNRPGPPDQFLLTPPETARCTNVCVQVALSSG